MKRAKLAILPAYNEANNIKTVITEIKQQKLRFDILVIDDGSEDNTASVSEGAGAMVIINPFNLGIGATVQTGFKYARDKGYQVVVQVDSDGQHPARELKRLIKPIIENKADVVIGSRFLSTKSHNMPFQRRLGTKIFEIVNSHLINQKITDNTSGFRAFNKKAYTILCKHYPSDFPEPEAIIILAKNKMRITEIPVTMNERFSGKSTVYGTLTKSIYYMAKVLLAILASHYKSYRKTYE